MPNVVLITTTFTCLAVFFVTLRLWTRLRLIKAPGWDDMLILNALIADIAFYAFVLVESHYGLGVPMSDLSDHSRREMLRFLWLSVPFYNLVLILAKLSALVFFVRIFHSRPFLLTTYTFMGVLILCGLWIVLSAFFFCVPVHDFWNLKDEVRNSHCLPEGTIWFLNAAIQIITDIVILFLPMPLLYKLNLPRRQKAGVILVFGVGIFVIGTSSARIYELNTMVRNSDYTKRNAHAAVWSSLEANVSIICACLPPLHPLLSRVFSYCFLPQPLHSSPTSKSRTATASNHTTHLASSRKTSIYEHGVDGGVFYNEFFQTGLGSYSASIAKVEANEEETGGAGAGPPGGGGGSGGGGEEDAVVESGIRVVRELTVGSDVASVYGEHARYQDWEHRDDTHTLGGEGYALRSPTIEWDLADFEFPDYKHRMNAPI